MKTQKRGNNNYASGRILYRVQIIHTQADMGGLGERVRKSVIREMGQQAWQRKLRVVDRMWDEIERFLTELQLPCDRVRLYQDGLPVCGREMDIVRDLALQGSRNHRLLMHLTEKGATLMGTESPELLVEEYRLAREVLNGGAASGEIHQRELLRRRDGFIARRINSTLRDAEIGILFLGMLHLLDDLLDRDIRVISVPPFPGEEGELENV